MHTSMHHYQGNTIVKILTGTSLERFGKVEAQLNQSAIDRIVSASTSRNTNGSSYTPKNGDVVA